MLLALSFSALFSGLNEEIAVIPIKGEISSSGDSFSSSMSSTEIAEKIKQADSNPLIKAIFLDIDSGGGSVVATKEIVYAVRETEKPITAYIGEIGASGAYYIAASSDLIIADEDSITGSIGVISVSANVTGLLEKLGIKVTVLKEGEFKDIGSPFKELNEKEKEILNELISEVAVNFKKDILDFRKEKMQEEKFNQIADGRILSGRKAKEIGLIDFTGSKSFAIKKTAELAGIKGKPSLKYFKKEQSDLFSLFSKMGYSFGSGFVSSLKASNSNFQLYAK